MLFYEAPVSLRNKDGTSHILVISPARYSSDRNIPMQVLSLGGRNRYGCSIYLDKLYRKEFYFLRLFCIILFLYRYVSSTVNGGWGLDLNWSLIREFDFCFQGGYLSSMWMRPKLTMRARTLSRHALYHRGSTLYSSVHCFNLYFDFYFSSTSTYLPNRIEFICVAQWMQNADSLDKFLFFSGNS